MPPLLSLTTTPRWRLTRKGLLHLYGRGVTERMNGREAASDADIAAAKKIQPDIGERFAKWGVPAPSP